MKRSFSLSICLTLIVSFAYAQVHEIPLSRKSNVHKSVSRSKSSVRFSFSQDKILSKTKTSKDGAFTDIWLEGSYPNGEVGTPSLPAYKKLIRIPKGSTPSVNIVSHTEQVINLKEKGIGLPLYPNQPSVSKNQDTASIKFEINKTSYAKNSYTYKPIASIEVLGNLRSATIARLVVNPVDYNPGEGLLKVYNDIDVNITYDNSLTQDEEQVLDAKTYSPYFDFIYKSLDQTSKSSYTDHPNLTKYPVKMLIISDRIFEQSLQPFIQWKKLKGFNINTVYTDEIGSTASQIKTYVQQEYNSSTPESPAPSFLVIAGDINLVPESARGSATGSATDLYYASIDGDMFPDMYYGRLSATTTTQLENIITKIIYYEKYQFEDPSYLSNVTLIAGSDGTWNPNVGQPTIKYGTANYFNSNHGFSAVNEFGVTSDPNNSIETPLYSGCYGPDKISVGLINYTAHGSETSWVGPSLENSAISAFTNLHKYPLVVGNCCLSGDFGTSECFGEAWIRAQNKGAVTYIGSSPNTFWLEDFYWSVGAFPLNGSNDGYVPTFEETTTGLYDAPFVSNYVTTGGMVFAGNLAVTEVNIQGFPKTQSPSLYYWEAYNILGDPSLIPYLSEAEPNQVTYSPTIIIGESTFSVSALANSYIAISKNDQLIGSTFVTNSGLVSVPISPIESTGEVSIVITRPQTIPIIDTITAINPTGPYLSISTHTIDDHLFNNNGKADYGETFGLNLNIKNIGIADATNIRIKISGNDNYITITSNDSINISDISHINGVNTINLASSFTLNTVECVPDQHVANFNVVFYSDQGTWTSILSILLNSPVLTIGEINIDDSETFGNNNKELNPGESCKAYVQIKNIGHALAKDISFLVNIPDSIKNDVSINNIMTEPISLDGGSFSTFPIRVSVNPDLLHDLVVPIKIQSTVNLPSCVSSIYDKNINVISNNSYRISSETIKTCFANFYDSGGKNMNYSSNEDYTYTVFAGNEYSWLKVKFSEFSTEAGYDFLYIYNGPNSSSPQVIGSPFSGNSIPSEFISTGNSITFRFKSDSYTEYRGWSAIIECADPQIPDCVSSPIPSDGTIAVQSRTLRWSPQAFATHYNIYIGTSPTSIALSGRTNYPEFNFKTEKNTTYYWKVIPENYLGLNSTCTNIWSFTTAIISDEIYMSTNTITVDTLLFYDSGGSIQNYSINENSTLTFKPKYPDNKINVQFSSFDIEGQATCNYDKLSIYNGLTTSSPIIGSYCGTNSPGTVQASNPDGALTFVFKSDGGIVKSGWGAIVKSVGTNTFKTITLKVQNNSLPIANASINIGGTIKSTDEDGLVKFSIIAGDIDLTANASGYKQKLQFVPEAETNSTIIVNLDKFSTINAHVFDKKTLTDLFGVKVKALDDSSYTNPLGIASLYLTPGSYSLNLYQKGYLPYNQTVTVNDDNIGLDLSLTKAKNCVKFNIYDAFGNPVSNVNVSINDTILTSNSEGLAVGYFHEGTYFFSISKPQYFKQSAWILVVDATIKNIILDDISSLYTIRFEIVGVGPKSIMPLNYNDIDLFFNNIPYSRINTDLNGIGNAQLLRADYSYNINREGYCSIASKPLLVDGTKRTIQDTLYQKTYNVQFNVSSDSSSIEGATITLDGYTPQRTNSSGQAIFSNIGYEKKLGYTIQRNGFTNAEGVIDVVNPLLVEITLIANSNPIISRNHTKIYPNPTSNQLYIESEKPITKITVINTLGVVVLNKEVSHSNYESIPMNNLTPGVYILIINSENSIPENSLIIKK